jgi:uncharacterized Ntn-hydrolase superfamily protein
LSARGPSNYTGLAVVLGVFNTFSVVGRCARTGDFGVAVATARPTVGSVVPWASLAGAVATQARTNTAIGRGALALLERDVPVAVALERLLANDPDRDHRQAHGVDRRGEAFAYTGSACVAWCGHRPGDGFSVAGNMLTGPEVLDAMAETFSATAELELAARLVAALEAGQAAGGDKRGKQSAALLVASAEPCPYHNLRVDDHADPVAELRRLFDLTSGFTATLREQYGDDGLRRYRRVKL